MNVFASKKWIAAITVAVLLFSGCTGTPSPTQPPETTVPVPVGPTAPPDGNPADVTCQGSYSVANTEAEAAADKVIATLGDAVLTNGELQAYYRMAIAAWQGEEKPNLQEALDTQLCPLEGTAVTWQQFFLQQALDTWQRRQSIALLIKDSEYNESQQAFLDSLPELTAGDKSLTSYAALLNTAYFAFSSQYAALEPTAEALELAMAENSQEEVFSVDIRHILLTPEADPEALLREYKSNGAQEDDFAILATVHSQDAHSCHNGGLYRDLRQGWLIQELDAWCFDPAREPGETAVIQTELGTHILYFRSRQDCRAEDLGKQLTAQRLEDALSQLDTSMTVDYSAIALASVVSYSVSDLDLLYPDPELEQYPEMPLIIQHDYPSTYYGPGRTVASHGCGLACFSMVATYLLDEDHYPDEMGPRFARYSDVSGTARPLFNEGAATMGIGLVKRTADHNEAMEALRNGHVVVSLQVVGLFTNGGHYIVLSKMQEDGKITVLDPNIYNYGTSAARDEGFANGFTVEQVTACSIAYWIYEKKDITTPACSRCGMEETSPILAETYLCTDCRTVLHRQGEFWKYCK